MSVREGEICIHCGVEGVAGSACGECAPLTGVAEKLAEAVLHRTKGSAKVRFALKDPMPTRFVVFDETVGTVRALLEIYPDSYARFRREDAKGIAMESRVPFVAFSVCRSVAMEIDWGPHAVKLKVEGFNPDVAGRAGF